MTSTGGNTYHFVLRFSVASGRPYPWLQSFDFDIRAKNRINQPSRLYIIQFRSRSDRHARGQKISEMNSNVPLIQSETCLSAEIYV